MNLLTQILFVLTALAFVLGSFWLGAIVAVVCVGAFGVEWLKRTRRAKRAKRQCSNCRGLLSEHDDEYCRMSFGFP